MYPYEWGGDLAPVERRGYRGQNCLHDVHIVGNAELIWNGEQERVGLRNCFVFPKLLDENVRLSSIAAAEDCPRLFVKETDLVLFVRASSEVGTIAIIEQREDTPANRNARSSRVTSILPGGAKGANLGGLLDVERLPGLVEF